MITLLSAIVLHGLLIGLLYLIIALLVIWLVFYVAEKLFGPFPPIVKTVLGVIIVILVLVWAINILTGGTIY